MSKKAKDEIRISKVWLRISIAAAMVPWASSFLIGALSGEGNNRAVSHAAGMVVWVSVIGLALTIVALFYVKGKRKLIVFAACISIIIIGYLALFTHSLLA